MSKSLLKSFSPSPDLRRLDLRPILTTMLRAIRLPGLWLSRVYVRDELRGLNAHQMRDVGLNPLTVQREVHKPFWRA